MTHIDNTARAAVEGACGKAGITGYYDEGAGTTRIAFNADKFYIGDVPPAWWLGNPLDALPSDGFIYLGSPYSLYEHGHDKAAAFASEAAGYLMLRGFSVFAPIPHGHFITSTEALPPDWSFWRHQCDPFIDAASSLVVLKLDGWRDSVGLTYEIARFHEAGKPIVYATMEEL